VHPCSTGRRPFQADCSISARMCPQLQQATRQPLSPTARWRECRRCFLRSFPPSAVCRGPSEADLAADPGGVVLDSTSRASAPFSSHALPSSGHGAHSPCWYRESSERRGLYGVAVTPPARSEGREVAERGGPLWVDADRPAPPRAECQRAVTRSAGSRWDPRGQHAVPGGAWRPLPHP
jgi:hypothetical protein